MLAKYAMAWEWKCDREPWGTHDGMAQDLQYVPPATKDYPNLRRLIYLTTRVVPPHQGEWTEGNLRLEWMMLEMELSADGTK